MGRGAYNRMGRRALLSMSVLLATSACGTEQGDSKEPEASGFLRPVEAQAGVVQAAERVGLAEEGHQPRSASPPPGEVEAERPRRPEPPAAADQPPARKEGSAEPARLQEAPDEATLLELASALVHSDPAAFDQLLARKGQGLPDARRRLVLAVNELRSGADAARHRAGRRPGVLPGAQLGVSAASCSARCAPTHPMQCRLPCRPRRRWSVPWSWP